LSPAIPKKGDQVYGSNTHTRYHDASRICLHKITFWAGFGSDSSGVDLWRMRHFLIEVQKPRLQHRQARTSAHCVRRKFDITCTLIILSSSCSLKGWLSTCYHATNQALQTGAYGKTKIYDYICPGGDLSGAVHCKIQ
jgi:hypothetical protein